ncbi:MAG: methyltransferase domain-containing protein [Methanobrevibacter sp.]|nr:methyltransferase domain-containing protein [Methanobrevibacter sp.]MBE6489639.1 methyltransferase domain-containing protein [Methanobrevibacter sp.]
MHKSSYQKMQYFKDTYLNPNVELKILDIGSYDKFGNNNYSLIFNEKNWIYKGLDLVEGDNVDIVVNNPYDWIEIDDEEYDVVVSGQAFEHIEFFWETLNQIKRILKPNGLLCIIAPSSGPEHRNPFDCYRFNDSAMKSMAKYIKFHVLEYGTDYDETSNPWNDTYLIAKKIQTIPKDNLNNRLDLIEKKLNYIISQIQ